MTFDLRDKRVIGVIGIIIVVVVIYFFYSGGGLPASDTGEDSEIAKVGLTIEPNPNNEGALNEALGDENGETDETV